MVAMLVVMLASAISPASTPPVPGGCSAPALENVGRPGCFLAARVRIENAPAQVYWHILSFEDAVGARAEGAKHKWSAQAFSHGRIWLYVLGPRRVKFGSGARIALIGPMRLQEGQSVTARFIESIFPPGMRTRVHSHPGPEAFFVIDGEQCMETPTRKMRVGAGGTFIVPAGPHVQAAAKGRRNIAVVFQPDGTEWMLMEDEWRASDFCFS